MAIRKEENIVGRSFEIHPDLRRVFDMLHDDLMDLFEDEPPSLSYVSFELDDGDVTVNMGRKIGGEAIIDEALKKGRKIILVTLSKSLSPKAVQEYRKEFAKISKKLNLSVAVEILDFEGNKSKVVYRRDAQAKK